MKSDLEKLIDAMANAGQQPSETLPRGSRIDQADGRQADRIIYLTTRPKGARVRFQAPDLELE